MSDLIKFKELERFRVSGSGTKMTLGVPLPKTASGKRRLECPNDLCQPRIFFLGQPHPPDFVVVNPSLIRRLPGTPGITCPYCGFESDDENFITELDKKAAIEKIEWAVKTDVERSILEMFQGIGRGFSKSGPITMEVKTTHQPDPEPRVFRRDLLRNLECAVCTQDYGVYAVGFFCPDCGATNLTIHFLREIELIGRQVQVAREVENQHGEEFSYRMLGNSHEDVVTALETYLKVIYKFLVRKRFPDKFDELTSKKTVWNSFQNIEKAQRLFAKIGIDPFACLDSKQLACLKLNLQKRHVIGHNLSMADDAYLDHDDANEVGQTVALIGEEIINFAQVCGQLILSFERDQQEFRVKGLNKFPSLMGEV